MRDTSTGRLAAGVAGEDRVYGAIALADLQRPEERTPTGAHGR
jgi:hypothetical protein